MNYMRSIYDNVSLNKSIASQKITGSSAIKGAAVDTLGYNTGLLELWAEAASGTPDAATLAVKLQESATTTDGDFADALDNTGAVIAVTLTVTAAAAAALLRVEGLGLQRKRYLRVVATPTFTNGTSPGIQALGIIGLGRGYTKPSTAVVSNT